MIIIAIIIKAMITKIIVITVISICRNYLPRFLHCKSSPSCCWHSRVAYMGVPKCTSCHKAIMEMTRRACCIEIMHIHYAHPDLLRFEHTMFLKPTFLFRIYYVRCSSGKLRTLCFLEYQQHVFVHGCIQVQQLL